MIIQDSLVTLKISKKIKEQIKKEAQDQNIPLSEYLRRMIFKALNENSRTV